ncbi:hypothetical protein IFM89_029343 [Coptis chinensis]|uniref:Uncharacterized protein n=1 Tax=Coptis chinensis TaxID=261450 RepID=A0A835MCI1_9MAGN|nr:hypothetical protein IFM89_029343 [Coptis chinensis]
MVRGPTTPTVSTLVSFLMPAMTTGHRVLVLAKVLRLSEKSSKNRSSVFKFTVANWRCRDGTESFVSGDMIRLSDDIVIPLEGDLSLNRFINEVFP